MPAAIGFDRAGFGGRLSQALERTEASSRQISDATNLSRTTVAAWAAGERSPNLDRLAALAAFLDADLAWLLFGEASPSQPKPSAQELERGVARLRQSLMELAAEAEALTTGSQR